MSSRSDQIYSDKIARFACECDKATGGAVIKRLQDRFTHIYIDEMQDISGPDLDFVELLLKSSIKVTLIGDHRQATFNKSFLPESIVTRRTTPSGSAVGTACAAHSPVSFHVIRAITCTDIRRS